MRSERLADGGNVKLDCAFLDGTPGHTRSISWSLVTSSFAPSTSAARRSKARPPSGTEAPWIRNSRCARSSRIRRTGRCTEPMAAGSRCDGVEAIHVRRHPGRAARSSGRATGSRDRIPYSTRRDPHRVPCEWPIRAPEGRCRRRCCGPDAAQQIRLRDDKSCRFDESLQDVERPAPYGQHVSIHTQFTLLEIDLKSTRPTLRITSFGQADPNSGILRFFQTSCAAATPTSRT